MSAFADVRDDMERGAFGPYVAEQWMVAGGLLVFALAYVACIAPSLRDPTLQKVTRVVALVPPVVAYLLLRPASFGEQNLIQLSTSQWVALLTAVPAAIAYLVYFKAAEMHPDSAMALNLEEFYAAHPEEDPAAAAARAARDPGGAPAVEASPGEGVSPPGAIDAEATAAAESPTSSVSKA
jgi:phosphatidylglycerol:prolipoprotein diacylglycerol transferase